MYAIRSYYEKIPKEKYKKYQRMFNPVKFDARRWVKLAQDAGMKYICT